MAYQILMNVERKEAYLLRNGRYILCDGTHQEEEETFEYEYRMKNLTKYINHYMKIVTSLKWDLEDTIVLYEKDEVYYYDLNEYKHLNFIIEDKKAHYL